MNNLKLKQAIALADKVVASIHTSELEFFYVRIPKTKAIEGFKSQLNVHGVESDYETLVWTDEASNIVASYHIENNTLKLGR